MKEREKELALDFYQQRQLVVKFSEVDLSSDAGILLARQAEERVQICQGIAQCIEEWRDPKKIQHPLEKLVSQRIYQLVGGYEDADDSDQLRHDPIYKIACGQIPKVGENELASQPTISRLENHISRKDLSAIRRLFVEQFLKSYREPPSQLILDIDGWADPTYGEQEGGAFHGYYGHKMYFPVLINEASHRFPLVLQLRRGNSHAGKGVAGLLRWLFWRLRQAWPQVTILLRGDAGFSLPEIVRLCERSKVDYVLGFASNAVLKRKIDFLLDQARILCCKTGRKARLFDDVYYAAGTWEQPRRLIMKAEWLPKGANPRFVLTNLTADAQQVYDSVYVQRGADSEHPIKELKLGLQADRLSCSRFDANQFRLLLAQAAYLLMITLRQAAQGTELATAQVSRLRSALVKVAARVRVSCRRVLVELAAFCPFSAAMQVIAQRLSAQAPL
ncbi:MAG: IS1380 family transposase [Cyanobacteria bacterium P01_G01_bin.54]